MEAYDRFVEAVNASPSAVALDEAALCIAAHAAPGLDIDAYLVRLDELAAACRTPTLDGLLRHLFGKDGFRGNVDDYYDPRNSLLDQVIDRRLGIPITLAVVTMEVGRRIGVPMWGVGLPGHFLLRDKVDPSVYVDPFNNGAMLDERGCRRLHRQLAGPSAPWDDAYLEPVERPAILARMLNNLKAIYAQRREVGALRWVLRLRAELPDASPAEREDLARLMAPFN
jgi:regulator of sirC expression with transglutaminase-like and TPR domain